METWHYIVNQFVNATDGNYKKMLKLSNYHDAYLHKMMTDNPIDPDWATLYSRYHPVHLQYVDAYTTWKATGGAQMGLTLNMEQLLLLLIKKVGKWDAMLQAVDGYEKRTPNYKTLFPRGHAIFGKGAKTVRVTAVKTLGESLAPFALAEPAIGAIKTQVDAFYALIDGARETQEGTKGGTKMESSEVESKRIQTGIEQYRNLGFLMNKSADAPLMIAPFFELSVLRRHNQVLFTGTLDANETEAILIHSFVADDELRIKLTGLGETTFYLATCPGGMDSNPVTVLGDTDKKIALSQFGVADWGTHRFLTAVNNGIDAIDYKLELL